MATKDLEPTAAGSTTAPTVSYVGGAGDFSNLKSPDNDATSYMNLTNNPATQSFWIDALYGAATVDASPTVRSRARKDTTGFVADFKQAVRIGGSITQDTFVEPSDNTWFTDTSPALARPGGGSWTPADFPGGTSGTEVQADSGALANAGTNHNWSSLWATVTYTPSAGGYYYLIGCWLPPLIAAASHGLSLAEIAGFLSRFKTRPGGPSMREELDLVRRAHLARPKFSFSFERLRPSRLVLERDMIHRGGFAL